MEDIWNNMKAALRYIIPYCSHLLFTIPSLYLMLKLTDIYKKRRDMKKLGIVILATNAYFVLGVRFIRRWAHHYKGDFEVEFHFFSDTNPKTYLPKNINVVHHFQYHTNWVEGTNSKFKNILKLCDSSLDYIYYFDADTNIKKDFDEQWMLGDLVGGEHYAARTRLCCGKGFDRNPRGQSYVPHNTGREYVYHYGAFFGGTKDKVCAMNDQLRTWQMLDQKINYEPPVNDESYINKYFHYKDHYIVPIEDFAFEVSDKGGLGNTRQMNLNVKPIKEAVLLNSHKLWDIQAGKIVFD